MVETATQTERTDEAIKKDIVDHLYWDNRIDSSDINVSVDEGDVTLSGTVPNFSIKQAARDAAYDIDGVGLVFNDIEVDFSETESIPSDEEIESRVDNSLLWDDILDSTKIDVDVDNGFVTLQGTVDTTWKKYRAENKVEQLDGVIDITNELTVVPTGDFLDENIAKDLVESLERNIHTDADAINIKVEDGEVTLSGTVNSWKSKHEAFDAALRTAGVTTVENNLVVDTAI
ncbi:MAG: BON domain-containing protein [bacterium]